MDLQRVKQEIFAELAGTDERAQIGSMAAGTPLFTTDKDTMQALSNFKQGLYGVCVGENSPALEDINALYNLITYQLAYIFQKGIPQWLISETYYIGSIVSHNSKIFRCKTNNINGVTPIEGINWEEVDRPNDHENMLLNMSTREFATRSAAQANDWRSVCYGNGRFVAVSVDGTNKSMYSTNGINWVTSSPPAEGWRAVCFSEDLGLFVAVAISGSNYVMTSPNGITWTTRTAPSGQWNSVKWISELSLFIATKGGNSSNTQRIMTSPDGINWTAQTTPDFQFNDVTWSEELSRFVAVGIDIGNNYPRAATSTDGVTWTTVISTTVINGRLQSVIFHDGIFKAFGGLTSGIAAQLWSSTDGVTWVTEEPVNAETFSPLLAELDSVVWSEELKAFIGTTNGLGSVFRIATSLDGYQWTVRNTGDFTYNGLCWSKDLSVVVAVAANHVATSK